LFVVHVERLADITDRCGFVAEGALLDLAALIRSVFEGKSGFHHDLPVAAAPVRNGAACILHPL